jgi:hypothetical protein
LPTMKIRGGHLEISNQ